MISFSHVDMRRPNARDFALSDFNLTVEKGELTVLFGGSGSGKTTIFKLLTREWMPDAGEIMVTSTNIALLRGGALAAYRRSLGYVSQGFPLLEDRTVEENIRLPLEINGMRKARLRDRITSTLDRFNLNATSKLFPKSLSASERQRVAIARAVVTEPMVLLADEPTAYLDPRGEEEIVALLRNENMRGMTVLLGTSDERLIAALPEARIISLAQPVFR
jgi:cell division transport system ATP-binding protein